jgi:hypothetical protein
MEQELFRLSASALDSEELAAFAIRDLLPAASEGDAGRALEIAWEAFQKRSVRP